MGSVTVLHSSSATASSASSNAGPRRSSIPTGVEASVARSFDVEEANRIINDPSVFPFVTLPDIEKIDLAPAVANHLNVLLVSPGGCFVFFHDEPGIYELHTNFLEDYRGRHVIACARLAIRWMFTHTDCMTIITRIPAFNVAARPAARMVGFTPEFERKAVWPMPEGGLCAMRFYALPYRDWIKQDANYCITAGRIFHARMQAECKRLGAAREAHVDEDCHDLAAGACMETVLGGQPEKAVILYNRWARFAGYGQIALLARSPLVLDIGDAVLMMTDKTFKVIKCR